ncbi:MAG: hypothetical protein ACUVTM_04020 [Candidatus Bathyarchaeia archaeon]
MRTAYRRSQSYLQTETPSGMEDVKLKFRRELLIVAGYSEDVATVDLKLSDEDIRDILRKKLLKESINNGNGSRGIRQKAVPVDDVEKYIESGWEYVSQLPNSKAIVKGLANRQELQPQVNHAQKLMNG